MSKISFTNIGMRHTSGDMRGINKSSSLNGRNVWIKARQYSFCHAQSKKNARYLLRLGLISRAVDSTSDRSGDAVLHPVSFGMFLSSRVLRRGRGTNLNMMPYQSSREHVNSKQAPTHVTLWSRLLRRHVWLEHAQEKIKLRAHIDRFILISIIAELLYCSFTTWAYRLYWD
jgi:hypothetical protein